jgi:hypothetical protein
MTTINLRGTQLTPLTIAEVDANFTNLNDDKLENNGGALVNGSINSTTIGATTASTGKFTTLSATGNSVLGGNTAGYGVFYVDSVNEKIGLNLSTGLSADTVFQLNRQTDGENYLRIRNFSSGSNNKKSVGIALDIPVSGSTTATKGTLIATSGSWNYGSIPANAMVLSSNLGDNVIAAGGSSYGIKFYTGPDSDGWGNSQKMIITSTGDVGIGNTPSGTYKLEVTGTGFFSNKTSFFPGYKFIDAIC